jgi:hypothetical protein
MRGSLGEKIGEGASADVHAWAPGQVVKLFKSGVPRRLSGHEVRMTRAVFAAGAPAPEVLDEVTLEGRFGIVVSRFDGPTLLQLTRTGAMTRGQAGTILATLCLAVHKTPPPPDVLALRDWIDAWLRSASGMLPKHIDTGIRALIERLSPGDGLPFEPSFCDLKSLSAIPQIPASGQCPSYRDHVVGGGSCSAAKLPCLRSCAGCHRIRHSVFVHRWE